MPNMTVIQAQDENIYSLLEHPQVVYRDELMEWDGIGERELMRRLESMFTTGFKFLALTDDQISTIKGILYPEKAIKETPATFKSVPGDAQPVPDSSIILTLDIEQERLATDIRDGHRLFYGVAGSGKTLILLSRAKLLANRLVGHRVLVLCFNITLAAYLRSLLHDESYNPLFSLGISVDAERLAEGIACSIAVAGIAISIALSTSPICILGYANEKSLRCTTLNFHSWEQCLIYMTLSLN